MELIPNEYYNELPFLIGNFVTVFIILRLFLYSIQSIIFRNRLLLLIFGVLASVMLVYATYLKSSI